MMNRVQYHKWYSHRGLSSAELDHPTLVTFYHSHSCLYTEKPSASGVSLKIYCQHTVPSQPHLRVQYLSELEDKIIFVSFSRLAGGSTQVANYVFNEEQRQNNYE